MKMIFPSITRVFTTTVPTGSSKVTCAFSLTENTKTYFTKKKSLFFNFLFNRTATTTKESAINEETTMASTTST